MKSLLLALAAASSVAAQLDITLPAEYGLVNAIDPKDPEYTACTAAENVVEACVISAGGTAAIRTADPTTLLNCLCCAGSTAISPLYSICSTYLADEAPRYRTQADSFGDFYSLCGLGATCTGGVGGGGSVRSSSTPRTTTPATRSPTPTPTPTGTGTGSSRRASVTATTPDPNVVYPEVCEDMIAIFTSCTAKINNFMSKPYVEQAECYCCRTGRNGAVTWTDELDNYGKSCATWAITGEPVNAYPVAETFASFCQNFPNACQAATTTPSARTTGGSGGSSSGGNGVGTAAGDVTVTVTPTSTNAANGLRAGCGAAVVAGAALAFAL